MNTKELTKLADDAYYMGAYPKAIQLYQQILKQAQKNKNAISQLAKAERNPSLTLLVVADDAYYATEYDKAIQLYLKVLENEPKNRYAQTQLAKAERNLSLKASPPQLPTEAIQLYKRSRSFIAAGDLPQAEKLLTRAVTLAKEAGVEFPQAEELLKNLLNASKAEELKKEAFKEIDTQQWANALDHLDSAIDRDPTDETTQILKTHLQSLLRAQGLITKLNAEISQDRKQDLKTKSAIQKIIDQTNEVTVLSKLWQEVVRSLGEYNNKVKSRESFSRYIAWGVISAISVIAMSLWFLYSFPRSYPLLDCLNTNGIVTTLNYPNYIANGDSEKIEITIKNGSNTKIDGSVLVDFHGTAKIQLKDTESNEIEFEDMNPSEQISSTIYFSLNEPLSLISDPSQYINFSIGSEVTGNHCSSKDFHIAITPIYGLRTLVRFLWGSIGVVLIGLFWEKIKKFLRL